MRARLASAISCGALLLAGCGDDGDQNEREAARDVVEKFALADGPEACDYLGGQALEDNYGGNDYATGSGFQLGPPDVSSSRWASSRPHTSQAQGS